MRWTALSHLVLALIVGSEAFAGGPCEPLSHVLNAYIRRHERWLDQNDLVKADTIISIIEPKARIRFPDLTAPPECKDQIPTLVEAALSGKFLAFSDMNNTPLQGVNFTRVLSMRGAWLSEADLQGAKFRSVDLETADLTDANLRLADLTDANLRRAKLIRANLDDAIVRDTTFAFADVRDATYSPKPTYAPSKEVVGMKFVHTVRFGTMRESGMAQLRKIFKDLHLRDLEQDATFSIRRHSATFFEYVAFQLTVGWGREPGRALKIMLGIFVVSSLYYALVIGMQNSNQPPKWKSRILLARLSDHLSSDNGDFTIQKDSCAQVLKTSRWGIWGWSVWFSALSAFHIGWRDLNFGTWLTRIQPDEFVLRGYGLLRIVSGVQSLLSVYLLAIWAVTTFGRPFE